MPLDVHRADARADEMIGAACAQSRQFLRIEGVDEIDHLRGRVVVRDAAALGRQLPTQEWQNRSGDVLWSFMSRQVCPAKHLLAHAILMLSDKLPELVDDLDAVQIAFALRIAPRE